MRKRRWIDRPKSPDLQGAREKARGGKRKDGREKKKVLGTE